MRPLRMSRKCTYFLRDLLCHDQAARHTRDTGNVRHRLADLQGLTGVFSSSITPVDLVGLYWHLVDLIWIYLFPLLYLIH